MKIYGASGHGKVIAEIAELLGIHDYFFVDDYKSDEFFGKPVLPSADIQLTDSLIIAIGDNKVRKSIVDRLPTQTFETIKHPYCNFSMSSTIGKGCICMAGSSVNADTAIGDHAILNTNCSIDHDCELGDFVHISPGVNLAGNVKVGEGTHIGIGASVIQGVKIGKWAVVGAGAVVIEDIPDYAVVVGVPAKIIKFDNGEA